MPLYEYAPLEEGEIRLLVILPGKRSDAVRIRIENWHLDQNPAYAALSYVWGDAEGNKIPVFIDDFKLEVLPNLWQALRRLRDVNAETTVWADALCINQKDKKERSAQILHMPKIYPQANKVVCWLGDDDGTASIAFNALLQWAEASGEGKENAERRVKLAEETNRQIVHSGPEQSALDALFNRPWWRRVWTLQEVCVDPKNPPLILCGEHDINWKILYLACLNMFKTLTTRERCFAFGGSIEYILPMLQTSWADRRDLQLSYLVPLVAKRDASEPRDKIFSLLGLTASDGRMYPAADYHMSAEGVCISYTRAIIEVDQSVNILLCTGSTKIGSRLPSWAINLERMYGDRLCLARGNGVEANDAFHRFRATLNTRAVVDAASNPLDPILRLYGLPVDCIKETYHLADLRACLSEEPMTWWDTLVRVRDFCIRLNLPDSYRPSGADMVEAALRTLSADDCFVTSQGPQSWYLHHQEALYASYQRQLLGLDKKGGLGRGAGRPILSKREFLDYLKQRFRFQSPKDQTSLQYGTAALSEQIDLYIPDGWLDRQIVHDLLGCISGNIRDRCFFVTQRGYIGLGPPNCRLHDEVCLLFGSSLPFVLRPLQTCIGTAYQLLDEAYVEGIMYGEGMREYRAEPRECNGEVGSKGLKRYCLI